METLVASWIGWLVLAPLLGAIVAFVVPGKRRVQGAAVAVAAVVSAAALAVVTVAIVREGPLRIAVGGWDAPAAIRLSVDGLSVALLAVAQAVLVASSVHASGLLKDASDGGPDPAGPRSRTFWPLWLLLWAGLGALFLSADLFNLYVSLELVGLAGVALVATAGGERALRAALRYFFANVTASLAFLVGVALVYHREGTLDLALLRESVGPDSVEVTALALMTAGLALKAALFPLHAWLPAAHSAAPAPVSAVLSALVVKAPVYLLVRIWLDAFRATAGASALALVAALGAVGLVWGSLQALRTPRLKLLVAYSTVAQVGLLATAFPIVARSGSETAWLGLVILACAHALAKAAMFLAAGALARAHGHDRLRDMGGFGSRQPVCTYAFGIAGVSLVGVPGSVGFVGKWMLATSGLVAGAVVWVVVVAASALLTAAYVWRVLAIGVRNPTRGGGAETLARREGWTALALAATTLVLGAAPGPLAALAAIGAPTAGAAEEGR